MMGEVRLSDSDARNAACLLVCGVGADRLGPFLQAADGWEPEKLLQVILTAATTKPEDTGEALHVICDLALSGLTFGPVRQELLDRLIGNLAALRTPHPADVTVAPDETGPAG